MTVNNPILELLSLYKHHNASYIVLHTQACTCTSYQKQQQKLQEIDLGLINFMKQTVVLQIHAYVRGHG